MGYADGSLYGLTSTRLNYDSVCLNIGKGNNFQCKPLMSNLNKLCMTGYGVYGKVHLWFYVIEALLWLSVC
jgi:hypothetical protein